MTEAVAAGLLRSAGRGSTHSVSTWRGTMRTDGDSNRGQRERALLPGGPPRLAPAVPLPRGKVMPRWCWVCGAFFDVEVWHCFPCGRHIPAAVDQCGDCASHRPKRSPDWVVVGGRLFLTPFGLIL